jgi:hypothetical protein
VGHDAMDVGAEAQARVGHDAMDVGAEAQPPPASARA